MSLHCKLVPVQYREYENGLFFLQLATQWWRIKKKPFKLQRGCYTQATCLTTLRKVNGRSTFLATRNATIAVAKWDVTCDFFLATCNATFVARKIASCNVGFIFAEFAFRKWQKFCLFVFLGGVIPVMHSVLTSMFIHTRKGSSSLINNRWLVGGMQQNELMVAIVLLPHLPIVVCTFKILAPCLNTPSILVPLNIFFFHVADFHEDAGLCE